MLMILSGDWTTHLHLGIHRPIFNEAFESVFDMMVNGGVTLAFRPYGEDTILRGMAVCSLSECYSREVGRNLSNERIHGVRIRAHGQRDPQRGVRTVELDGFITDALRSASSQGKFRQFAKLAKNLGVPIVLATRVGGHPVWGWMPDGEAGQATFDGMVG